MAGTISIFPSFTSESNWERGLSNDSFRINKSPSLLPAKWGKRGKSPTGNETRCRKKRTHANYERMRAFLQNITKFDKFNENHNPEIPGYSYWHSWSCRVACGCAYFKSNFIRRLGSDSTFATISLYFDMISNSVEFRLASLNKLCSYTFADKNCWISHTSIRPARPAS